MTSNSSRTYIPPATCRPRHSRWRPFDAVIFRLLRSMRRVLGHHITTPDSSTSTKTMVDMPTTVRPQNTPPLSSRLSNSQR